jgi:hypothetical protein
VAQQARSATDGGKSTSSSSARISSLVRGTLLRAFERVYELPERVCCFEDDTIAKPGRFRIKVKRAAFSFWGFTTVHPSGLAKTNRGNPHAQRRHQPTVLYESAAVRNELQGVISGLGVQGQGRKRSSAQRATRHHLWVGSTRTSPSQYLRLVSHCHRTAVWARKSMRPLCPKDCASSLCTLKQSARKDPTASLH